MGSSSSCGREPSNSGSTGNATNLTGNDQAEVEQPEIIDLTGDDAPEIIDLTGEDSGDPPEVFIRRSPRQICYRRERRQRVRTERNRSRSRSPLRSHRSRSRSPLRSQERTQRECREREERPMTSQQVQRMSPERDWSSNLSQLRPSERTEGQEAEEQLSSGLEVQRELTERNRSRSRSPLRSPQENVAFFTLNERQMREQSRVETRVVEEQDPESNCSICLMEYETGQRLISLQCSHEFHSQCLTRWLQENPSCPLCRLGIFDTHRRRVRLVRIRFITEQAPDGTLQTVAHGRFLD